MTNFLITKISKNYFPVPGFEPGFSGESLARRPTARLYRISQKLIYTKWFSYHIYNHHRHQVCNHSNHRCLKRLYSVLSRTSVVSSSENMFLSHEKNIACNLIIIWIIVKWKLLQQIMFVWNYYFLTVPTFLVSRSVKINYLN